MMRKFIFAAGAAAALAVSGLAQASAPRSSNSLGAAIEELNMIENAQYVLEGRQHCWYDRGWHGPGWYWCGYAYRRNLGWGGEAGWNGWERRRVERREERRGERRED